MASIRKRSSDIFKMYIIPLVSIGLAFLLAGNFIINSIKKSMVKHMVLDSNRHAENHKARLINSISANKAIEKLFEDRLKSVSNFIIYNIDDLGNQLLKEAAETLMVDEIHWYNSRGEIIYSNDKYIGWRAKEGHPVYNFMIGDKDFLVEKIRKDSESKNFYKYAYSRVASGEFVQIGILADSIEELTKRFCPQVFIDSIVDKDDITHAYILNNQNDVIFYESEAEDKIYHLDEDELKAIEDGKPYYTIRTYEDREFYESLLPIVVDDVDMGTLIIYYSLESVNTIIGNISLIAIMLLFFVFSIYSLMIISINKKNKRINRLAYYDKVTNLPNMGSFLEFTDKIFKDSIKGKNALMVVNFSNLNLIKLIYGHEASEDLLAEKANILRSLDIEDGYIFKYSEDSFLIYMEDYTDEKQLIDISDSMFNMLDRISDIKEYGNIVNKRTGILKIDQSYKDVADIVKHIEATIDKIQRLEDNSCWFFNKSIQEELMLDKTIEKELRKAIYGGYKGFYLEYQPQMDLNNNKIIGLEALARWNSEELGFIPPSKFIDIAERFQLITLLGEWVMKTACEFIKELEIKGVRDIKIAINISIIQLLQDNFIDILTNIIADTKIDPRSLELEITESSFAKNIEFINDKLEDIRRMGISISLDDFGTGYSSLARLKSLNIDVLKIDKSFIDNIVDYNQDDIFVKSIILLANQLGIKTVAEGVETMGQREYLKTKRCDIIQGYIFSRPVVNSEAINLIYKTNKK